MTIVIITISIFLANKLVSTKHVDINFNIKFRNDYFCLIFKYFEENI